MFLILPCKYKLLFAFDYTTCKSMLQYFIKYDIIYL
nr:MAG TPA: hypothetical protein [Bacteriophage sp.]